MEGNGMEWTGTEWNEMRWDGWMNEWGRLIEHGLRKKLTNIRRMRVWYTMKPIDLYIDAQMSITLG